MIAGTLFSPVYLPLQTEGVKYAGSKLKLLPDILDIASSLKGATVWDAFSGTTRVSQSFAQRGYNVVSSDISVWSECFSKCYLLNRRSSRYYEEIIRHLNNLKPIDGWFSENYGAAECEAEGGRKSPWQLKNTRRLDAIRQEIEVLKLPDVEKSVVLTSLILALDKVDNTVGHYVSYLKEWSPRSYNDLRLEIPRLFETEGNHKVIRGDIFDLLPTVKADIAYLDPPYGSNNEKMPPSRVRYSSYYHLWTTVILNDRPQLFGKANRRLDTSDTISSSVFEEYKRNPLTQKFIAVEAIERMLRGIQAEYVILSYSSTGRATMEELVDVLESNGTVIKVRTIDYKKNVMSEMRWTNEWAKSADELNKEFLFVLKK